MTTEVKAQHTPEPWSYVSSEWGYHVVDSNGKTILDLDDACPGYQEAEAAFVENVRRIAAAVTACKGIPTEALEGGAVNELILVLKGILVAPAMTKGQIEEMVSDGRSLLAKLEGK